MTNLSPQEAWDSMVRGNQRFVSNSPKHPHQDAARRANLADGQDPIATVFGCSDSRLAAEVIFDKGLGDLFVVRNAGQVVTDSVVGTLEFAVAVLDNPLILVLGHDSCGAVNAAIESVGPDAPTLPTQLWRLIAPIVPAARKVMRETNTTVDEVSPESVGRAHLQETVRDILHSSEVISEAVESGRLGIVAANYHLADGKVDPHFAVGIEL